MTVPLEQLRRVLKADEPNYASLVRLGPAILPQLLQLVKERDPYVAGNAASLAGMVGGPQAAVVLQHAARSPHAQVRASAASAIRHAKVPAPSRLLAPLLSDHDKGVRKFAIKAAAGARAGGKVDAKLNEISLEDPEPVLRAMAASMLKR